MKHTKKTPASLKPNYKVRFPPKKLFRKEEVSLHSSPFKIFYLGKTHLPEMTPVILVWETHTGHLTNHSVFVLKKVKKFNTDLIFIPRHDLTDVVGRKLFKDYFKK